MVVDGDDGGREAMMRHGGVAREGLEGASPGREGELRDRVGDFD